MAANRRKTIEYAFATRITRLATSTTLATTTRHDTPSITLFIPETTSRLFRSVRLVVSYRAEYTATNSVTGWRMGIKLGAAAPADTDRTFTGLSTANKNLFDVIDVDVTDYFNTSFGTGASQTCVASLAVATTAAANVNGLTFKLVITYEFDASAQATRIKTIRIPIQSQTGTLTAAQQEVGTDGTNPAPASQIPALDAFLPEASKVYRQLFLESTGNDSNVTGTTAFTPFLQIDAATETARATIDQTLQTALTWRDILDVTGAFTTSAAHALKLRCDLAGRMGLVNSTLVVTYEYSAPATTTVMCEAMIPLTMSSDDSPGITAGESFSNDVPGDAQALIAVLSVQESNPVLVQSAAYLTCVAYSTTAAVNLRAGSQSFRAYSPGTGGSAAQGDSPLVHRVDHGGGWTLARGDNRLVLSAYNATTARSDLFGHALINYRAAAPSDVDAATHVVNYAVCSYGTTFPAAVDIAASSASLRVPVLGTPYRLQGVLVEQYHRVSNSNLFAQMLVEQRTGEWDAAGFITTGYRHGGFAQFGSWRSQWALTRAFNLDHLHTGKLNIETARRQIAWTSLTTAQSSWSWWLTYHQLAFGVAGTVTVGTIPVPTGKPVQIFARDASSTELVTTTTTGSGGIFNVSVVDSTRTYFASYQDGATLGRSADATPGAAFNIAIPSSAAMPIVPAATDVHGQLAGDSVQLSWSHPGDIAAQGIAFDIYQSSDPTDLFRTAAATSVPALTVSLAAAPLRGDRYFTVVARRGNAQALPSRAVQVSIPAPPAGPPTPAPSARGALPTGVGFPFGISSTGSVFAQGGDDLLRGKILQLLLTSPGERVNRPDYGTRLLDLVFDPNSDVLAATMEFTITRALQQEFADDIQVDSVQLTPSDDTLLVDISYLRKADLRLEQVRVGVPLPAGGSP